MIWKTLILAALSARAIAQPVTVQDDLNLDGVPDLVFAIPSDPSAAQSASYVELVDGSTGEVIHTFTNQASDDEGFAACALIGADISGDGIAEIYISSPKVRRWGGFGSISIYDGVTYDLISQHEGFVSDIFGLEIQETPDTDGNGWDEIRISSHFIDTNLNVWREWLRFDPAIRSVVPLAEEPPELVLMGADIDGNGVVDLADIALLFDQLGSDDPGLDLDSDGSVTTGDADIASNAWQDGAPTTPANRLMFWAPETDPALTSTGEAVLNRTPNGGLGGGSGSGGSSGDGGSGGGGGGGGGGDDDGGGGGGGGGGGSGGGGDDDGNSDDDDENETKPACVFDNFENWIDTHGNCSLVLIGHPLGRYTAIYPGNGPTVLIFAALSSGEGSGIAWSVSGAEIDNIQFSNSWGISFCRVLVEEPGTVAISVSASTPCGTLSVHGKTRAIELDLDIDGDNNDGLGEPSRDDDEELAEFSFWPTDETPGKVALTNTLDDDHDGIQGFIDGINMFDVDTITADDEGGNTMLVPLILDVNGPVCPEVAVQFSYQAARPPIGLSDEYASYERLYEPYQKIRLWRTNSPSRDPRSILDGGDYIPPNVWIGLDTFGLVTLDTDGFARPVADVTLWVEPITPSTRVGDVSISAKLSRGIEGSMQARDEVKMTATEVMLWGQKGSSDTLDPVMGPITSECIDDNGDGVIDENSIIMTYILQIYDPRASGDIGFTADEQHVDLYKANSRYWVSDEFVVFDIDAIIPGIVPKIIYHQKGHRYNYEYNPQWTYESEYLWVTDDNAAVLRLVGAIIATEEEINIETWLPPGYETGSFDSGAYGKLIHAGVTDKLHTDRNWLVDVYCDHRTREILSIGQPPAGGVYESTQVDAIRLDDGYRPTVGSILDPERSEIYEIKSSANGDDIPNNPPDTRPDWPGQEDRLKALNGNRKVNTVSSRFRWSTRDGKLIKNTRAKRIWAILEGSKIKKFNQAIDLTTVTKATVIASGVCVIAALINADRYDLELRAIESKVVRYIDSNGTQALTDGYELVESIAQYMQHFSPDANVGAFIRHYSYVVIALFDPRLP